MRAMLGLTTLAAVACAPLRLSGKSEHCRRLYDACLNTCPVPQGTTQPAVPQRPTTGIDTASCTLDCNHRFRNCE